MGHAHTHTFNHYNQSKIRIEGRSAQDKLVTGIFYPNGLSGILAIVREMDNLSIEHDGNDWIIKARE